MSRKSFVLPLSAVILSLAMMLSMLWLVLGPLITRAQSVPSSPAVFPPTMNVSHIVTAAPAVSSIAMEAVVTATVPSPTTTLLPTATLTPIAYDPERVEALAEEVGTLAGRVDALEKRIDALSEKIDTLAGRVNALDKRVSAFAEEGDTPLGRVNALDKRVDTLIEKIDTIDKRTRLPMFVGILVLVLLMVIVPGVTLVGMRIYLSRQLAQFRREFERTRSAIESQMDKFERKLPSVYRKLDNLTYVEDRVDTLEKKLPQVGDIDVQDRPIHQELQRLEEIKPRLDAMDKKLQRLEKTEPRLDAMDKKLQRLEEIKPRLDAMDKKLQRLEKTEPRLDAMDKELRRRLDNFEYKARTAEQSIADLKHQLMRRKDMMSVSESFAENQVGQKAEPESSSQAVSRKEPRVENTALQLQALIMVYDGCRGNATFVPVVQIMEKLVKAGVVSSEEEATRMINRLVRAYPEAVRLGAIRGQIGDHIAIYKDRIGGLSNVP